MDVASDIFSCALFTGSVNHRRSLSYAPRPYQFAGSLSEFQ
jgi:hypothetical protein